MQSGYRNQPLAGIGFSFLAVLMYGAMNLATKDVGERFPAVTILLFRNFVVVVLVAAMLAAARRSFRTGRPLMHAFRAACGSAALYCYYRGIQALPLADMIALTFATPLFVTALSGPVLRERVGLRRWALTLLGFAGVLVIVRPGLGFSPAYLWPLAASLFFAIVLISVRRLAATETSEIMVFYSSAFGTLFALGGQVASGVWVPPSALDLALLSAVGVLGGLGQYCLAHAYRRAPAAVVAPIDYTQLILAIGTGWLIWGERPSVVVLAGAALLIAATLGGIWLERKR